MKKLKTEVIKYSKKLNVTNLSALRSGNISVRVKENGVAGFYITPSGRKYSSLKPKDIVFVSFKGVYDKKKGKPSSEWRSKIIPTLLMLRVLFASEAERQSIARKNPMKNPIGRSEAHISPTGGYIFL